MGKSIPRCKSRRDSADAEPLEPRMLLAAVEQRVSFEPGMMAADAQRDLVYMLDLTNSRVLAIDTDAGTIAASAALVAAPHAMAISPDGNSLYVTEPLAKKIEVFTLPSLTLARAMKVNEVIFDIAVGAKDRLYVTRSFHSDLQLNALTGRKIRELQTRSDRIFANADGSRTYSSTDLGLQELNTSGAGAPTFSNYYFPGSASYAFAVDDAAHRIYVGQTMGPLAVIDLTRAPGPNGDAGVTNWSFTGYPSEVAVRSASSDVFAAVSYGASTIKRLRASDGAVLASDAVTGGVFGRRLAVTANGHVLYASEQSVAAGTSSEYYIGAIGIPSLQIEPPRPRPKIDMTQFSASRFAFDASRSRAAAGKQITKYRWDFGDGTVASGRAVGHSFIGAQDFTVRLTLTDSAGQRANLSVTITAGDTRRSASISGRAYDDVNFDNDRDADEAPLPERLIWLDTDNDGVPDAGELQTTTKADGTYFFGRLRKGTYVVRQMVSSDRIASAPPNTTMTVKLAGGAEVRNCDFGSSYPGTVIGTVYNDIDGDGSYMFDSDEDIVRGRTVWLDTDDDGTLDPGEPSAITDVSGSATFSKLRPGPQVVRMQLRKGEYQSRPFANAFKFPLQPGDLVPLEFLYTRVAPTASISGTVFNDANDNDRRDSGDSGAANVRVFLDLDGDGAVSASDAVTTTDSRGRYTFNALTPGGYIVAVAPTSGWRPTFTPSEPFIHVVAGEAVMNVDLGATQKSAALFTVYEDFDGNGKLDGVDDWFSQSATVFLDLDHDAKLDGGEPSLAVEGNGTLRNLSPGTYLLRVIAPSGYRATFPTNGATTITLKAGKFSANVSFGVHRR